MSRAEDVKRADAWLSKHEMLGEALSQSLASMIKGVRAETLEAAAKAAQNAPLEWTSPFMCRENVVNAIRALKV